jgi:hypothetical protein
LEKAAVEERIVDRREGNAKTGRKRTRRTEDWHAAAKGSEKERRKKKSVKADS